MSEAAAAEHRAQVHAELRASGRQGQPHERPEPHLPHVLAEHNVKQQPPPEVPPDPGRMPGWAQRFAELVSSGIAGAMSRAFSALKPGSGASAQ